MAYYAIFESSPTTSCSLGTIRGLRRAQEFAHEMAKTLTADGLSTVRGYKLNAAGDFERLIPEFEIDPREALAEARQEEADFRFREMTERKEEGKH
jgi:hypothetical protein